jgi:uncharacterized protein (TIGR02757 family)
MPARAAAPVISARAAAPSHPLGEILLSYAREAPLRSYREHDPVRSCHRYPDPRDREVVALLSALLAFGRVDAFLPRVEALLARMSPHPRGYLEDFHPRKDRDFFSAFRLRLWKGDDLRFLFGNLRDLFREHPTLEDAFLSGEGEGRGEAGAAPSAGGNGQPPRAGPEPADHRRQRERIGRLHGLLFRADPAFWTGRPRPPPYYPILVVDPAGGSACKRWNLFLRWVVRPADGVDLGLWRRVSPRDLVVPLDIHVGRISRLIGLRRRRTLDWRAAEEVTRALSRIDPEDPLRFDLPLSHLGISSGCRGRYVRPVCEGCGLRSLCKVYRRARARQPSTPAAFLPIKDG